MSVPSPSLAAALAPFDGAPEVLVVTGPLGGGDVLMRALLGLDAAEAPDECRLDEHGACWAVRGRRQVLDRARATGLGMLSPQLEALPATYGRPGVPLIAVERDPRPAPAVVDLAADVTLGAAVFRELASRWEVPDVAAAGLRWGAATRLLDHLPASAFAREEIPGDDSWLAGSRVLQDARREVADGGIRLLELGRVLVLLGHEGLTLGDEWPQLAAALSGRRASLADVYRVLQSHPGLFQRVSCEGQVLVRAASPAALVLLAGDIPPSASEHHALFRALRERAESALARRDASDDFIARSLPRQATAAGSLAELLEDGVAILCSHPAALIEEIEDNAGPALPDGAKATLLCAHRLGKPDAASQLELAARRQGLTKLAEHIHSRLPDRTWRPLWATTRHVHTHRVLQDRRSAALASTAREGATRFVFVGYSDGEVWELDLHGEGRRAWSRPEARAEVRALAMATAQGEQHLVIATSDHVVRVVDPVSGKERWADGTAHTDPLSAVAAVPALAGAGAVVVSSGVGGQIVRHDLLSGRRLEDLPSTGQEVRSLRTAVHRGRAVLGLCRVDGRVILLDAEHGTLLFEEQLPQSVINAMALVADDEVLRIAVGTTTGRIVLWELRADVEPRSVDLATGHSTSAVNGLRFADKGDSVSLVVARADGSWHPLLLDGRAGASLRGHVGPINGIVSLGTGARERTVTVGGEGACRLWTSTNRWVEDVQVVTDAAVQAPVTAVALERRSLGIRILTGDADGSVRRWGDAPDDGAAVTFHDGEVTGLAVAEAHGLLAVAVDGSVRLDRPDGRQLLLGMAHEGVLDTTATGDHAWTAGADGGVTRWDLGSGEAQGTASVCRYGGAAALALGQRKALVVGCQDGSVVLLDAVTLELRRRVQLDVAVTSLCVVPGVDGLVIAALVDGTLALLQEFGPGARSRAVVKAHSGEVRAVAALRLPGRTLIASTGLDRRLRVAELMSGRVVVDIELDGYGLALAAHGTLLALGTTVGAALLTLDPANDSTLDVFPR